MATSKRAHVDAVDPRIPKRSRRRYLVGVLFLLVLGGAAAGTAVFLSGSAEPPTVALISTTLIVAGSVSDFTASVRTGLRENMANAMGVELGAVALDVEAASARLSFVISFASLDDTSAAVDELEDLLSSTSSASDLLSMPEFEVEVEEIEELPSLLAPPLPRPPASPPSLPSPLPATPPTAPPPLVPPPATCDSLPSDDTATHYCAMHGCAGSPLCVDCEDVVFEVVSDCSTIYSCTVNNLENPTACASCSSFHTLSDCQSGGCGWDGSACFACQQLMADSPAECEAYGNGCVKSVETTNTLGDTITSDAPTGRCINADFGTNPANEGGSSYGT